MPLDLPSNAQEVIQRAKTDVQRLLPESNPFLKNSVLGALTTGIANRNFDFYIQLRQAVDVLFIDTAEGEFLERWAAIYGKTRLGATTASGNTVITGVVTSVLVSGSTLVFSDGVQYLTTSTGTVTATVIPVASITRSGTTATVTTVAPHELANNVTITIAGADQTEYNITTSIQAVDALIFTYPVDLGAVTPATGTITASGDFDNVSVISVEVQDSANDVNVNQDPGAILKLQSPVVGIDDSSAVDSGSIAGGVDQETDESLRSRTIDKIQNPVAHFNTSDVVSKAKEVNGVTRVFVFTITPAVGQATIYFMRDNDSDPIPSAPEVADVRTSIEEIIPVTTDPSDIFILAPVPVVVSFAFISLTPNTPSMQSSILNNLQQFFSEETSVGVNVDEDKYRAAISNTIDTATGDIVQSFSLSAPLGDIAIAIGEIGVLDTGISFP